MTRAELSPLTADWIAKHGEPRRFPRGFSGEWFNIKSRLESLGYEARMSGSWYTIRRSDDRGASPRLTREKALARIDEILIENGLQPFQKRKGE